MIFTHKSVKIHILDNKVKNCLDPLHPLAKGVGLWCQIKKWLQFVFQFSYWWKSTLFRLNKRNYMDLRHGFVIVLHKYSWLPYSADSYDSDLSVGNTTLCSMTNTSEKYERTQQGNLLSQIPVDSQMHYFPLGSTLTPLPSHSFFFARVYNEVNGITRCLYVVS